MGFYASSKHSFLLHFAKCLSSEISCYICSLFSSRSSLIRESVKVWDSTSFDFFWLFLLFVLKLLTLKAKIIWVKEKAECIHEMYSIRSRAYCENCEIVGNYHFTLIRIVFFFSFLLYWQHSVSRLEKRISRAPHQLCLLVRRYPSQILSMADSKLKFLPQWDILSRF